jgi:outer membrane murein-binding lipoprotein Lpp
MMAFAYVTIYEIHLTQRIRQYYPGDSWERALEPDVAASASERDDFCHRKALGEEVDLLDCLGFLRKEQIILCTGQLMSECTSPNRDPRVLLSRVRSLRNAVAHGSSLVNGQRRWADVYQILRDVRTLNARLEAGDGQDSLTMREEVSAEHA